ncbi:MAG: N-6 DNA methylase [Acidobacteriia bacterium]|nr:N-6 DNA methylase [Terriglobia bacterium]
MNPLEIYLKDLYEIRSSGEATDETSYYPALRTLLNNVGAHLKPKVRCVINIKNRGAGLPDGGLFTQDQFQKLPEDGQPLQGQIPARGAIEVKSTKDDAWLTADSRQVSRYWNRYSQVLVTNYRDFLLVGRDKEGNAVKLESYRLATDEKSFWGRSARHRKTSDGDAGRFAEFLKRVMLSTATLTKPKDVAWVLASYARDAKLRLDQLQNLAAMGTIREALEQALGLKFSDPRSKKREDREKGEHFFRSSIIQTLFYGMFSAWVLWSKKRLLSTKPKFSWREEAWALRVPVIRVLFNQFAMATATDSDGMADIVEVLDWAQAALNRVDHNEFFKVFEEQHAVQYFYEPFLEAFDPELRKQLGVWYTPSEVVEYMVARTDQVLRDELGVSDGFAASNVYVLDPCCGTGAYLIEVLRTIEATLKAKSGDALIPHYVKHAALERLFGFEILPAPFVISHLQMGLVLEELEAPLNPVANERARIYLTNSLTGWEPPTGPKQRLMFHEMEEERDAADNVKQHVEILVIIGNPPYNGFAGVGMEEEHALTEAYRSVKQAPTPQGQGLNDLYVRFFRIAERKIVEGTHSGIVCFISNYSWLDGLSHTGMRERYLEIFDKIWIDSLNGDKYKTGKLTPDGQPDPSVFSTDSNPEGIQVGTAVALLVRKAEHQSANAVQFRHLWGKTKRTQLLASPGQYETFTPGLGLGLSLMPGQVATSYLAWPLLPELFPVSFPGVKTSRDDVVVDIDRDRLAQRMQNYFSPEISHEEMLRIAPGAMTSTNRFQAQAVRNQLLKRGFKPDSIVRYCYRPFDVRWLYWEPETKLLDEKRAEYFQQVCDRNVFLFTTGRTRKNLIEPGVPMRVLNDLNYMDSGARGFPLYICTDAHSLLEERGVSQNISNGAASYIANIKASEEELFYHTLAILHAPTYRADNGGALRQNWPRVPLPDSRKVLLVSAALGRQVAALLDTETEQPEAVKALGRSEVNDIAVFSLKPDHKLNEATDFELTAGWGHAGKDGATMPGKGKVVERAAAENAPFGKTTYDIYLNDRAYWKNIPPRVWEYTIGGYQVIKKWLSYRESKLLGRPITPDEARYVSDMARRIAALCLLQPQLDSNYTAVKANLYAWPHA